MDVTVQKQILEEIYQLSRKENLGVLFITHDLGVVAEIADDVSIMKDGEIVENGTVEEIFIIRSIHIQKNCWMQFYREKYEYVTKDRTFKKILWQEKNCEGSG